MNENDIDKLNTPPKNKRHRVSLLQQFFHTPNEARKVLLLLNQVKRPNDKNGIGFSELYGISFSEMYEMKEKVNFVYSVDNTESVIYFRHDGEDAIYNSAKKHFELTTFRLLCVGENWQLAVDELLGVITLLEMRNDKIFAPVIKGLDRQNFRWDKIKILFNGTHIKVSQGGKDLGEYDLEVLKLPKLNTSRKIIGDISVRNMFSTLFLLNQENQSLIGRNISNADKNKHKQKERLKKIFTDAFGTFDDPFKVKRTDKKSAGIYEPLFQTGLYGDLEVRSASFSSGVSIHKQTKKQILDSADYDQ